MVVVGARADIYRAIAAAERRGANVVSAYNSA